MIKRAKLVASLAFVLALGTALASCTPGQAITSEEVVKKMRETMKATQSVQGTVDVSLTINKEGLKTLIGGMTPSSSSGKEGRDWAARLPDSASATLNVWKEKPDKARVEVASATLPGASGAILVYDGQKAYLYDAANNTLYTASRDKLAEKMPDEMQAIMGDGADMEAEVDKLIDASDIKLAGTEKVAGLDAYRLDITPKPDFADRLGLPEAAKMQAGVLVKDGKASLWVDKDRWIPLKLTLEHPNMGQLTYTANVELNKPVDASKFVLQAPAGAKTVDLDEMLDKHEGMESKSITLQEARDAAAKEGWKLLEPTYLPEGATLVGVEQGQVFDKTNFTLSYSSASLDFSISETRNFRPRDTRGNDVSVRGNRGVALSGEGADWTRLEWLEDWLEDYADLYIVIEGTLSLDEALKIAEGLQ